MTKPIIMDVGCAKGHFCLEGAKQFPAYNWLGLEIREALTVRANTWRTKEKIPNLHYVAGNASAGMKGLLASLPKETLQCKFSPQHSSPPPHWVSRRCAVTSAAQKRRTHAGVTIQCPDPCFKKKHQKRYAPTRLASRLDDWCTVRFSPQRPLRARMPARN